MEGHRKLVKFLYDKLVKDEPIGIGWRWFGLEWNWNEDDERKLTELKEKLTTAPVLSLPDLNQLFELFINVEEGIAYGVIVQEWCGVQKPIAYVSKWLDLVVRGWPICLQAAASTGALVEEGYKLTFGNRIKVYTPHDLKIYIKQKSKPMDLW